MKEDKDWNQILSECEEIINANFKDFRNVARKDINEYYHLAGVESINPENMRNGIVTIKKGEAIVNQHINHVYKKREESEFKYQLRKIINKYTNNMHKIKQYLKR